MDISDASQLPDLNNHPLPEPAATADGFEAGRENRLRRFAARVAGFLFKPPHLPWPMALFATLWTVAYPLSKLMVLGPEYWAGGTQFVGKGDFYKLLDASPLAYLGFFLVQTLILGLAMLVINRHIAFAIFVYIGVDFFAAFGWTSLYILLNVEHLENWPLVGLIRLLTNVGAGMIWGLAFAGGLNMLLAPRDDEAPPVCVPLILKAALGLLIAYILSASAVTALHAAEPRATWKQVQTDHTPTGRRSVSLAYDTLHGQAVLFGGSDQWDENGNWIGRDDTWVWDGADWIEQHPAEHPSARLDSAIAYDEKRGVVVLFGGQNRGEAFQDTWEWDGAQWTLKNPTVSPPVRCCAELAYDPSRQQVVLLSGYAPDRTPPDMMNVFYYDAWGWDGQNWQEIILDSRRHTSNYAMLADPFQPGGLFIYDAAGRWTWQENRIRPIQAGQTPPGRYNIGLAYDPNLREIIAFGGSLQEKNYDETLRFDGTTWRRLYTVESPPSRETQAMFYDQKRGRIVMFGGYDDLSFFNDTWELIVP